MMVSSLRNGEWQHVVKKNDAPKYYILQQDDESVLGKGSIVYTGRVEGPEEKRLRVCLSVCPSVRVRPKIVHLDSTM